jgi:FkbM family methyltransferase
MGAPRLVAQQPLDGVIGRMFTAWAGRRLAARSAVHLQAGLPQLATYAFDHVGRQVALWGRYEREELELLMQVVRAQVAAPDATLKLPGLALDIGANIGNHALFFAEHFEAVWAFEPHPRTSELLRFNAALRPNVRCFAQGLSNQTGPAQLRVPSQNVGMATLHPAALGALAAQATTVPCQLMRLDDLPELAGPPSPRVALMKIDVEGHELAVLQGAVGLIERDRPVVVLEQAEHDIRNGSSAALDWLRQAGYGRLWVMEQYPAGRSRWLKLLRRGLFGEGLRVVECTQLEPRFHSMVVLWPESGPA